MLKNIAKVFACVFALVGVGTVALMFLGGASAPNIAAFVSEEQITDLKDQLGDFTVQAGQSIKDLEVDDFTSAGQAGMSAVEGLWTVSSAPIPTPVVQVKYVMYTDISAKKVQDAILYSNATWNKTKDEKLRVFICNTITQLGRDGIVTVTSLDEICPRNNMSDGMYYRVIDCGIRNVELRISTDLTEVNVHVLDF